MHNHLIFVISPNHSLKTPVNPVDGTVSVSPQHRTKMEEFADRQKDELRS